jgi:3'-phosphoadenosine 5'-phosphosulfate sulfotransferase (PAPS reductase)/FAD synthetase
MNLQATVDVIKKALSRARRPAVSWNGGKDPTVLLDLARKIMPEIEVIHFKLPFMSHKYEHQHSVQEDLKLTVHDWVPVSVALTHGNGHIDVCETYSVGDGFIKVMRGTEVYKTDKPWVCGKDWLNRPKAFVKNDFDVLLCGHKNSDKDHLTGSIPLEVDMAQIGATTQIWFPLRRWTDSDVAEYILINGVSYDQKRYNENVVDRPDKHMNADHSHACMNCVNQFGPKFVHCPKLGIDVENIHERVLHEQPSAAYCNVRSESEQVDRDSASGLKMAVVSV